MTDSPLSPDPRPWSEPPLWRVAEEPLLLLAADFVAPGELEALQALAADPVALQQLGSPASHDETGLSVELRTADHPLLRAIEARMQQALGLDNAMPGSLRLRRYEVGQGHPPHIDTYRIEDAELLATALLCVQAPELGGQTLFLDAAEGPLQVPHRAGQLVAWRNVDARGEPLAAARHSGATVEQGSKTILGLFVYGQPAALRTAHSGTPAPEALRQALRTLPAEQRRGSLRGFGRLLAIVDDGVPSETIALMREAADQRGVRVAVVHPQLHRFGDDQPLRDGDLLYRPAVSVHSARVEQQLWHPKVASFYLDPDGPLFGNLNATETFARAGLPVPRTFWLERPTRAMLRAMVDQVGGLPVVVKALGYSRGVGVMRADSLASLFSIVDFSTAEGGKPLLTAYIEDAVHWRVVVVGDRAVASYRNITDPDDFRTSGSEALDDYLAPLPAGAAELAVRACQVLRHAHGGVDILQHPSGRLYLLEANFPCYYAQAQLEAGVDVAGAMVDYLLDRAEQLAPPSSEPLPRLA